MTRPTDDHIRIKNVPEGHLIYCTHCGDRAIITLPASWDKWRAESKRFQRAHRHCLPGGDATAAKRDDEDELLPHSAFVQHTEAIVAEIVHVPPRFGLQPDEEE